MEYDIRDMMMYKCWFFILFIVLTCFRTFTQPADNLLWTGVTIKADLSKKFRVNVEEQARFDNNISHLNITLTEAGLRYELTKRIDLKAGFRYIFDPESHNSQRFSGDIRYTWSKKKFPIDIGLRSRYQHTVEEHTMESKSYIRNKINLDYNLSKLADPYIAYESYFRLNYQNRFTVSRYLIGIEWRLHKDLNLETYFLFEDEFGERNPKKSRIFGLALSYDLNL